MMIVRLKVDCCLATTEASPYLFWKKICSILFDFNRIIKLIDTLLSIKRACREIEKLFHFKWHRQYTDVTDKALGLTDELDDETSWAEGCLSRSELEDICICHAVHDICTHKPYSIPDLLRMNDFWVEAEVTFSTLLPKPTSNVQNPYLHHLFQTSIRQAVKTCCLKNCSYNV